MEGEQTQQLLIEARKIAHEEVELINENVRSLNTELRKEIETSIDRTSVVEQTLKDTQAQIAKLTELVDKPWYRDFRFWAGLSAVPSLLLAGWLVKFVSDDGAMLRLIHKGLGTEAALTDALAGKSAFRDAIERALQQSLDPKSLDLRSAIEESVRGKILEKSLIEKLLSDQFRKYIGVRHVAILSLGLVKPGEARLVRCKDVKRAQIPKASSNLDICLDAGNNSIADTATTIFGLKSGFNIDVTFGVSLVQLQLPGDTNKVASQAKDISGAYKFEELVTVSIDDKVVSPEHLQGTYPYIIDGKPFAFARYKLSSYKITDEAYDAFPMHSITITTKSIMPQNVLMNVAVLVSQGQVEAPHEK